MLDTNYINLTFLRPNTLKTCSHSLFFFFFLLHQHQTTTGRTRATPLNVPPTLANMTTQRGLRTPSSPLLLSPVIVCKISLSFRLSFSLSDMTNYESADF